MLNINKMIKTALICTLALSIATPSFAKITNVPTKEEIAQKLKDMENVFQSIEVDYTIDTMCLQKYSDCMDKYCTNKKADRCICSKTLETNVLPLRNSILKQKEKIEDLVNVKIAELLDDKTPSKSTSDSPFSSDEDDDIMSVLVEDDNEEGEALENALATEMATTLYNKANKECKSIAKKCSSDKYQDIVKAYEQKVQRACDAYVVHMQSQKASFDKTYEKANELFQQLKGTDVAAADTFDTCLIKVKTCMRNQCGAGYNDCYTCETPGNKSKCRTEILNKFDLATRTCKTVENECGEDLYDEALAVFEDEIDLNMKEKIASIKIKDFDASEDQSKEIESELKKCAITACGSGMKRCQSETEIETILDESCSYVYEKLEIKDDFVFDQARTRVILKMRNLVQ